MKMSLNKAFFYAGLTCAGMSLVGCASSLSVSQQEWVDDANVLVEAQNPELRKASKTTIPEIDVVADMITRMSVLSTGAMTAYIYHDDAEKAWNEYMKWSREGKVKDEVDDAGKVTKKGDGPAEELKSARYITFGTVLKRNTQDPEKDVEKLADYDEIKAVAENEFNNAVIKGEADNANRPFLKEEVQAKIAEYAKPITIEKPKVFIEEIKCADGATKVVVHPVYKTQFGGEAIFVRPVKPHEYVEEIRLPEFVFEGKVCKYLGNVPKRPEGIDPKQKDGFDTDVMTNRWVRATVPTQIDFAVVLQETYAKPQELLKKAQEAMEKAQKEDTPEEERAKYAKDAKKYNEESKDPKFFEAYLDAMGVEKIDWKALLTACTEQLAMATDHLAKLSAAQTTAKERIAQITQDALSPFDPAKKAVAQEAVASLKRLGLQAQTNVDLLKRLVEIATAKIGE